MSDKPEGGGGGNGIKIALGTGAIGTALLTMFINEDERLFKAIERLTDALPAINDPYALLGVLMLAFVMGLLWIIWGRNEGI